MATEKERRRRSVYSEATAKRVCDAIATSTMGLKRLVEADRTLPSESTIYLWVQEHPEFRDAYNAARVRQADTRMEACRDIALACEAEVKALLAAEGRKAEPAARVLISLANMQINVNYRLAAWFAPKTVKKSNDDDGGPWIGDKELAMPENGLDGLIC